MSSMFFGVDTRLYHYERTIGCQHFGGAGFRCPQDLAIGQDGTIYVVSQCYESRPDGIRITMMTIDEDFLGDFSGYGDHDGQITWPVSIAVDSQQNVYVTDDWLNRISIFDKQGTFLDKWGVAGSGDGQISKPAGIKLDQQDNVYLVDSGNNRVQVFTKEGTFLAKWGQAGASEGQFNLPWGLTIDHNGDVFVADWRNDRIQKFTADGQFLAQYGSSGSYPGQFNRPSGVAVDKDGDLYVADWRNHRVQAITPEGRYITDFVGEAGISKWGDVRLKANPDMVKMRALFRDKELDRRFSHPVAVEVDAQGRIFCVDCDRHRIQIYQKENY